MWDCGFSIWTIQNAFPLDFLWKKGIWEIMNNQIQMNQISTIKPQYTMSIKSRAWFAFAIHMGEKYMREMQNRGYGSVIVMMG
jgi:hypothetical protein